MVRDGIYYGVGFGLTGFLAAVWLGPLAAVPLLGVAAFCMYFFRDPDRAIPEGPVAVAPADGKVTHIRDLGDGASRVSVFLNILDVHVNRVPVSGVVTSVEYRKGSFKLAHLEAASTQNEQNSVTIEDGTMRVTVKQIAGLIARRILCDKRVGDEVRKGERLGLIKFGSRVDIYLGPEWDLSVGVGDKVRGGSSVLAHKRSEDPAGSFAG